MSIKTSNSFRVQRRTDFREYGLVLLVVLLGTLIPVVVLLYDIWTVLLSKLLKPLS